MLGQKNELVLEIALTLASCFTFHNTRARPRTTSPLAGGKTTMTAVSVYKTIHPAPEIDEG
jgi:hypothetical protein